MTIGQNLSIDLNCDLGEMQDPHSIARDIAILSIVSSCNIACGGHAGDNDSMNNMIESATRHNVRIGAHPSYPDKENFGRKSISIHHKDLSDSLHSQISSLSEIAQSQSAQISYVKPHGALYNDAADNEQLAQLIVKIVRDIDPKLAIMGLPHSALERTAQTYNITYISEAFIDRQYTARSRLQNRAIKGAVITGVAQQHKQALALATGVPFKVVDGNMLMIKAQSLCMHSDSEGALENAAAIKNMFIDHHISVRANP